MQNGASAAQLVLLVQSTHPSVGSHFCDESHWFVPFGPQSALAVESDGLEPPLPPQAAATVKTTDKKM
jgi:hypothetical protein